MAKITRLRLVSSIKAGPGSSILPNGTIENPEPYEAVDFECDDGIRFQVERPLTAEKVKVAKDAAEDAATLTVDGISTGDEI